MTKTLSGTPVTGVSGTKMVEDAPEIHVNAAPIAAKVALANTLDNAVKFLPQVVT